MSRHHSGAHTGTPAAAKSKLYNEMRKCKRLANELAGKPEERVLQNLVREYSLLVRNMQAAKKR